MHKLMAVVLAGLMFLDGTAAPAAPPTKAPAVRQIEVMRNANARIVKAGNIFKAWVNNPIATEQDVKFSVYVVGQNENGMEVEVLKGMQWLTLEPFQRNVLFTVQLSANENRRVCRYDLRTRTGISLIPTGRPSTPGLTPLLNHW